MTRLLHVAGLATTLISHSPAAADARHTRGAGAVRAVQHVIETTIRETTTSGPNTTAATVGADLGAERRQRQVYLVTAELRDRLDTSASTGDPNATLDPLQLAGDAIGICVNAAQIVLERADGTDYRAPLAAAPVRCLAAKRGACELVP